MNKRKTIIIIGFVTMILIIIVVCYIYFIKTSKMSCRSDVQDNFRTSKNEFVIKYRKNKVVSVKEVSEHTFKNKQTMDIYKEFLDKSYNDLKDNKYIDMKRDIKDLNYTIVIDVKVNKLNNNKLASLELTKDLKELKQTLSRNKFSCE